MIAERQAAVHQLAVEKGWWEKDRSRAECLMLVSMELAEAGEEYRNGKLPNQIYWNDCPTANVALSLPCTCPVLCKPEGVPVEIADVAIRLMDLAGKEEWETNPLRPIRPFGGTVLEHLWDLNRSLGGLGGWRGYEVMLCLLLGFAEAHGFDLWEAVDLKHRFNQTRPRRHGGKLA